MKSGQAYVYLQRVASRWVSVLVLLGCIAITAMLVHAAIEAQALGSRYSDVDVLTEAS